MHRHLLSLLLSGAAALAQTVTIPNGTAQAPGPGSLLQPWSSQISFPLPTGSRLQTVYGAANFTGQGRTDPIRITDLRWRHDDATTTAPAVTFANSTVLLSTSPFGWNNTLPVFGNHGPDVTTVYSGSITRQAFSGTWTVQSYCVDLHLTTPFDYDPAEGDLVVDVDLPGAAPFSANVLIDAMGAGAQAKSVSATTLYPFPGSIVTAAPVLELGYTPATGFASRRRLGAGCNPVGDQPFYELFAAGTFDLQNTSLSLLHGGSDYRVQRGNLAMRPLTGATMLNLTDDDVVLMPLTSGAIPFGAQGSTNALNVCSNGFVSAAVVSPYSYPNVPGHLSESATCWRGFWHDLNPAAAGSGKVWWEETPTAVHVTWYQVASYMSPGSSSTFQIQLEKYTGNVHFVYGSMLAPLPSLVGFCEGGASPDPGPTDLSAAAPFTRTFAGDDIALELAARPVLGTQLAFTTTHLPATHPLGALVFGAGGYPQGLSLTAIGMTGCMQYAAADAVHVFVPLGTSVTLPLALPANAAFTGVQIFAQSVLLQPYANPLGAITSNGWRLELGTR